LGVKLEAAICEAGPGPERRVGDKILGADPPGSGCEIGGGAGDEGCSELKGVGLVRRWGGVSGLGALDFVAGG
jgi:hypothetical protein